MIKKVRFLIIFISRCNFTFCPSSDLNDLMLSIFLFKYIFDRNVTVLPDSSGWFDTFQSPRTANDVCTLLLSHRHFVSMLQL